MVKKFQLKNDMTVLLSESRKSPVVSIQMWVHTGSADEKKGEEGISHFIEHLVFKGSRKFGLGEMASQIESHGGELNAYTSSDQTVFFTTISSQYIDVGLEVIGEMMGHPLFDPQEIDNEREVVIEEIKRSNDSPHSQSSQMLFSSVYKKHPYSIPVIGYESNIKKFTQKQITNYYNRRYVPKNMTLVIVGDFNSKELRPKIKNIFEEFEPNRLQKIKRKEDNEQKKPRINVSQCTFEEAHLYIAWKIPKAKHKDIPVLDILALILGQGDSSRLMKSLRIERPLTNSVGASTFTPRDEGLFAVSSSFNIDNLDPILKEIKKELEAILTVPPTEEELEKAKINTESEEFYSMESVGGIARKLGQYEHVFKNYDHHKNLLKAVRAIRPEDITRAVRKYLTPEKLCLVLQTPKLEEACEKALIQWSKEYKQSFLAIKSKRILKENTPSKKHRIKWETGQASMSCGPEKVQLSSGASLLLYHSTDTPIINLRMAMLGGVRSESDQMGGLSEILSRVWLAGTQQRTETEINRMIALKASRLNSFSGRNTCGLRLTTLKPFSSETLEIFVDLINNPSFPNEAVNREKVILKDLIKNRDDNPARLAIRKFMSTMFKQHPYGRDPYGNAKTVDQINDSHVQKHFQNMRVNNNLVFSVGGDFDKDKIIELLEQGTQSLDKGERLQSEIPLDGLSEPQKEFQNLDRAQTHVVLGYPGLTFTDERRYTLMVLESVLSGQGGRLFLELRDKESLAYTVAPLRMEGIDAGYFGAYIACSPEKTKKSIEMLKTEFMRLQNDSVLSEELERSKKYLIGHHDISLQKNSVITASLLFDDIYGLPYDEAFKFSEKIHQVDEAKIKDLAQEIFNQNYVLSVVGKDNPF